MICIDTLDKMKKKIAEMAGLAVTYGLSLNVLQGWAILILCSLENRMVAVERILQYTTIPAEPPLKTEGNILNSHWPSKGDIELRDLSVCFFNFAIYF